MAKRVRRKVVGCLIVAAGLGLLVWAWVARTRSDVPAGIRGLPRNGVFMDYEFGLRRGAFTGQLPAGYWESLRARAKALRELGAEFASAHVSWAVVEPDEGRWDFSFYRQFFQTLADEGLKIRFVLGQGPHGASTSIPTWYYAKHPDARFVNEDGQADTNDRGRPCFPSFWHPQTKPAFQRYLRRVRSGLLEQFLSATASYHLTFPGPYGEITYPQGHPLPHGSGFLGLNEMQRHFWCYDLWARRDFAARMKEKHSGDLAQLNRAWGTDRKSWDEVVPPLPCDGKHGSELPATPEGRSHWQDLLEWYRQTLRQFTMWALDTAESELPSSVPIVLYSDFNGIIDDQPGGNWQKAIANRNGDFAVRSGLDERWKMAEVERRWQRGGRFCLQNSTLMPWPHTPAMQMLFGCGNPLRECRRRGYRFPFYGENSVYWSVPYMTQRYNIVGTAHYVVRQGYYGYHFFWDRWLFSAADQRTPNRNASALRDAFRLVEHSARTRHADRTGQ